MKLNQSQLKELMEIACEAAKKAGQIISNFTDSKLDVIAKNSGSSLSSQVVTEVDFKSQQVILELIEPTLEKYGLALLSEEKEDDCSRFQKDYFWAIDPLDGTLPFIQKKNGFAVSIALISKAGIPIIGAVFDPTTSTLFSAIKGRGALKNSIKLQIPDNTKCKYHLIVDQARMKGKDLPKILDIINIKLTQKNIQFSKMFSHAGAVMNVCWAMENAQSCYFKLPQKKESGGCIWDYGAVACIFTEAGGIACDCSGNPLILNSTDTVFMHQKGILFATSNELIQLITKSACHDIKSQ